MRPLTADNVVVFVADGHRFALPGARVVEIARVEQVTPVPCDDPANLGVAMHRERVVPLLDLARRLGLSGERRRRRPWLCLYVRTEQGEIGFPIDTVVGFGPMGRLRMPEPITAIDPGELWNEHGTHPDH